jgi:hypothetical protein
MKESAKWKIWQRIEPPKSAIACSTIVNPSGDDRRGHERVTIEEHPIADC